MPPCAGHCCGHCCDHPCGHWCCCHCCCCCHISCCWYAAPCWKASCFSLSAFLLFLLPPHHPFEPACAHSSQSLDILLILVFWQPLFLLQELQPLPHMGTAWSQAFAMFIPPPPPFPSIFPFFFFPPPSGLPCGSPFFFFLVIPPALPLFPSILPPFFPPIITPAVFGHWGLAFAPASAGWLRWWRPGVVRAGRGWYHTLPLHKAWPFCRTECPFQGKSKWSALSRGLALGLVANQGSLTALAAWAPKLKQNMQHCSGCTWFCLHNMLLLAWQHLAMYCNTFFSLMYAEEWCCCMYNICTLHSPYTRLLPLCKALVCACTALLQGYCLYSRLQPFARQSTSCLFIFLKQFQPGS